MEKTVANLISRRINSLTLVWRNTQRANLTVIRWWLVDLHPYNSLVLEVGLEVLQGLKCLSNQRRQLNWQWTMWRRYGAPRRRKQKRLLKIRKIKYNSTLKVIIRAQETWISHLNQVWLQRLHPNQLLSPSKRRRKPKQWIHCSKELQINKKKKIQTVVTKRKSKRKLRLQSSHRLMWLTCCRSTASLNNNSQLICSAIC